MIVGPGPENDDDDDDDDGGKKRNNAEPGKRPQKRQEGGQTSRVPVQAIILVPGLIDARYFGLALMTAFTEFISLRRAASRLKLLPR